MTPQTVSLPSQAACQEADGVVIAGDCLPVMRALAIRDAVRYDLVLIDPPYNTGGRFIYDDRFASNEAWLDMMALRLHALRRLMTDDGALLVHIDEHQGPALRGLLARLFGEANDLGEIIWDKLNPKGDAGRVAGQHERILAFARDLKKFRERRRLHRDKPHAPAMLAQAARLVARIGQNRAPEGLRQLIRRHELPVREADCRRPYRLADARRDYRQWLAQQNIPPGEAAYRHLDASGRVYRTVSMAWPNRAPPPPDYHEPLLHPVTGRPCPVPARGWRNPPATMARLLADGQIVFGADHRKQPERRYWLSDNLTENLPSVIRYGGSDDTRLARLGIPFDHPKPVGLLIQLIDAFVGDEGRVLDCFAGSGSVGHACLERRAQGRDIRFTLVQSREPLDPSQPGQRAGAAFCDAHGLARDIAQITRARIERARDALEQDTGVPLRVDYAGFAGSPG
ncbi:MAG: site-specific DNA-methyltransferase [Burkholderiaceae bacterium]